jgi:hypothetical protein
MTLKDGTRTSFKTCARNPICPNPNLPSFTTPGKKYRCTGGEWAHIYSPEFTALALEYSSEFSYIFDRTGYCMGGGELQPDANLPSFIFADRGLIHC